jgi:aminoglycoside phosphotransferase (APT) family kinase protein
MNSERAFFRIEEALARRTGEAPRGLRLEATPLTGGLVSESVQSVAAHFVDGRGRARAQRFVVKQLAGEARREAAIYRALRGSSVQRLAPALVSIDQDKDGTIQLVIQQVLPRQRWPWRDVSAVSSVLCTLATLHQTDAASSLTPHVNDWNFELELQARAARLIQHLEEQRAALRAAGIDVRLALIRRLAARLPAWRQQLLSFLPLPTTVIHGDVHSGNVMLHTHEAKPAPVLIDWARARIGSPLEDVSSWLQSLSFWEPVARRRHDTLFGEYLGARGLSATLTRDLRQAYWLAGASNCFAGSLEYHVQVGTAPDVPQTERLAALRAVRDQLRILRRAEACSN